MQQKQYAWYDMHVSMWITKKRTIDSAIMCNQHLLSSKSGWNIFRGQWHHDVVAMAIWCSISGDNNFATFPEATAGCWFNMFCSLYPKTLKLHIVSHLTNADEAKNGKTTAPLNNWIQLGNVTHTHIYIYIHITTCYSPSYSLLPDRSQPAKDCATLGCFNRSIR